MNRHFVRIAGSALILAFATPVPAAAENVLRWASAGGAGTFDPHSFDEIPTENQQWQIYESLSDNGSNLEIVPQLAIAWKLIDPLTWEFALRKGVLFHDGTPFTAEDVVFSLERARAETSQMTPVCGERPRGTCRGQPYRAHYDQGACAGAAHGVAVIADDYVEDLGGSTRCDGTG
jgi:ABC-type transport system substrate-binding protein